MRRHEVDYTIRDIYKLMPAVNNYKVSKKNVYGLLKAYYSGVRDILLYEKIAYKTSGFGTFYIRKYEPDYRRMPLDENGNLNLKHRTVNWPATNKLFKEKPHLKEKKQFVYYDNDYIFDIRWRKRHKNSTEEQYTHFIACRTFKNKVVEAVRDKKIDYYLDA